jgi:hypothetical protein
MAHLIFGQVEKKFGEVEYALKEVRTAIWEEPK